MISRLSPTPEAKKRQAINKDKYLLLTTSAGLSRPREAVAIVDCWIWQIATENLFSKSLI